MVYLQGDYKYFDDPLYDVYAIGSLFTIVTVIFIPTLILIFHPIMILIVRYFEWGETKCVTFINRILFVHKLKPVLDSFQGDYKDNLSIFAGLLHSFLYRIIFFSIVVAASTLDCSDVLLLMMFFFIIILLIHTLAMPFKRYINNASYSLIYVLILTIIIIEYYLFSTGKSSPGLYLCGILLFMETIDCWWPSLEKILSRLSR